LSSPGPGPFVKNWTTDELVPLVDKGLVGRDYSRGRQLFGETKCYACHRFNNEGGNFGPDLTILSGRFAPRDVVDKVINPSKYISDQYAGVTITTRDGKVITGRIINLFGDNYSVNTNMLDPNGLTNVSRNNIETIGPSKISTMPTGLVDVLHEDEILDLLAYLLSRGDPNHKMFAR
jgi:putative heme-binding domain-containing protein